MITFTPLPWQAATAPKLEGDFARNTALQKARLVPTSHAGPEDVVIDGDGDVCNG